MTKEERKTVLIDLCMRLPYGVKVNHFGVVRELLGVIQPSVPFEIVMVGYDINDYEDSVIEDIKPYLRPMSSMTEEEKEELYQKTGFRVDDCILGLSAIDWLNAHHFDYRGLIEKGLAIEAPEGMYKS